MRVQGRGRVAHHVVPEGSRGNDASVITQTKINDVDGQLGGQVGLHPLCRPSCIPGDLEITASYWSKPGRKVGGSAGIVGAACRKPSQR